MDNPDRSATPRRAFLVAALLVAIAGPAFAQGVPYVPNRQDYGRRADQYTLSYCIDPRDPAWRVDDAIAKAIADALLIEPKPTTIRDPRTQNDIDDLYFHLTADCDIYFGFKLLPQAYPDWLTITRPYYQVGYEYVAKNPDYKKVSDIPRSVPIGPTIGTAADFRLIRYLETLPADERWPRYPESSDQTALQDLVDGKIGAALVWAPSYAALAEDNPEFRSLHVIDSAPLPPTRVGVGAVLFAQNTFLRTSVDQAIASLASDGTIAEIIKKFDFPATPPQ